MRRTTHLMALIASIVLCHRLLAADPAAGSAIDFDRQIRPLLSDNCFSCHGPDAAQRKGDLRLDLRDAALASGAISETQPATSLLVERIDSTDPEKQMPPAHSNKKLSEAQKQLLRKWVEQGARYTQHWAFVPPQRAEVPKDQHAIDYLINQLLQREGLTLSPPADPHTLARRLSLDLIGLPPSEDDVNQIVADPSPASIGKLIDRLLASPHYGERMSIAWLDVVRFADTIGYHSDTPRNVYPYRDYVITSFNSNKPFDQFTIEQVAGDLLPDATQEQKIASCFNRLLLTTEEGGAQPKDYEARYLGDRVRAIGTTWLGLTIGCSQCHDHKFDPVTMQDFYSMGAFFADIDEAIIGKREDGLIAPDPAQATRRQLLKVALNTVQSELDAPHPHLADEQLKWEQHQLAIDAASKAWQPLAISDMKAESGATLTAEPDHAILVSGKRPDQETYQLTWAAGSPSSNPPTDPSTPESTPQPTAQPIVLAALQLEVLPHASLPAGGSGLAGNGNFVLTEVVARVDRADATSQPIKFSAARASLEQTQAADKHPDKKWSAASTIDADARSSEWGWAILPDVKKPQQLQLKLAEPVELKVGDKLVIEMQHKHKNAGHIIGHFRWSHSSDSLSYEAPLGSGAFKELVAIARLPVAERKPEQVAKLREAFHKVTPALAELRERVAAAQKQLSDFEATLPRCLVSNSNGKRMVRILPRGNWQDESGPTVQPKLPAFLVSTQATSDRPLNRLDLARWLVAPDQPLTARVFVNRLWKQFFGVGLSKNLDDVGAQGEAPANGPLLDYLATEFVQSGWDIKHMVRLITTSRAYQQSSFAAPEVLARDPENRLIARQSRFRLPAELVRDNALSIAGLLSPQIGGPSVKPYQPDGYWENLNFPQRTYQADPAPLQHRRGLYVWWQRSFVHPSMLAFDAPTREECAADRPQSNIPQQALVLLNDPTYLEAARALAASMASEAQSSDLPAAIRHAFRRATARDPNEKEIALLVNLFQTSLANYTNDRAAATALVTTGGRAAPPAAELANFAAIIQVSRAILNLHEVITRS